MHVNDEFVSTNSNQYDKDRQVCVVDDVFGEIKEGGMNYRNVRTLYDDHTTLTDAE